MVGFGCAAALIATGAVLVAAAGVASAAPISGGVLQLVATPGVLADDSMAPGDHVYWPINANLNASTQGDLTLQIESGDGLAVDPAGLRLALASCPDAWVVPTDPTIAPTCDGGSGTAIIPDTAFADISPATVWHLGTVSAVSTTPLMATMSLPGAMPSALQGTSATINFGFTALGDTVDASPSDPSTPILANTGVDPLGPLLLAAGLLLGGITLARRRTPRSRLDHDFESGDRA